MDEIKELLAALGVELTVYSPGYSTKVGNQFFYEDVLHVRIADHEELNKCIQNYVPWPVNDYFWALNLETYKIIKLDNEEYYELDTENNG